MKELLAVVYFVRYFKQYLLGHHFVISTDHAALRWLLKTPEPIGQQAWWVEQLSAFWFDTVHRPGAQHQNANSVSWAPCRQWKESEWRVAPVTETQVHEWSAVGEGETDGRFRHARVQAVVGTVHQVKTSMEHGSGYYRKNSGRSSGIFVWSSIPNSV